MTHSNSDHHILNNKKILLMSFIFIVTFMLIEFIAGIITNSLTLLADSGHMFSNAFTLGVALVAICLSQKNHTKSNTLGFQRLKMIATAMSGLILIVIALYICIEAILRFQHPEEIKILVMLAISSIGLIINTIVAWCMLKNNDTQYDINMQSAYLHVLNDLLSSIATITAALCLYFFGWEWIDPLISIFIAALIFTSGTRIIKKAHKNW